MASSVAGGLWRWVMGAVGGAAGGAPLPFLAAVDFSLQWALCGVAVVLKTDRFYDLAGSATFILLAYLNYKWNSSGGPRQTIQTGCVCVWALRLGLFLFTRVVKSGGDRRFKEAVQKPSLMFTFWTMQGAWVFLTLLPTLLGVRAPRQPPIGPRDYLGWSLWGMGFLIEVVADFQKSVFRNNPNNKDKFIASGLWSISRHPNYFGEILLWFGLYTSSSVCLSGWEHLAVLCPLLDYLLITRVSGIPILEKHGAVKWGRLPQYQHYVANTPLLVPFVG